jgi:tetratricopeptide (TPR) repeat protein
MTRLILVFSLVCCCFFAAAQEAQGLDSLKSSYEKATDFESRFYALRDLAKVAMNISPAQADDYGRKLIEMAEESRNRKFIVTAYLENGRRCGFFSGRKEYFDRAINYFNQALSIARENKMDEERAMAQMSLSATWLTAPDLDRSQAFANEAFSILSVLKSDSLRVLAHITLANVYLARNEKILSLRNYLQALQMAEEMKNHTLMRASYLGLSGFYSNINAYDKAIDYAMLAFRELSNLKDRSVRYQRAIDMSNIGRLYSFRKNYEMAIHYYERSIAIADSVKFSTLKAPAYSALLDLYLQMDQPERALSWLRSESGLNLQKFMTTFGFSKSIDRAFAIVYTGLGKYDSAKSRFAIAAPFFEQGSNEGNKLGYYAQVANMYEKTGDHKKAIDYYLRAKEIAMGIGSLESLSRIAKHLDSLYAKTGEYELSYRYNSIYYQYKDSLEKMNREKDLAQVEATDEQQRLERARREEQERIRRKNNIQYMGITLGIAALFVVLVVFGMFRVSANTIRLIGFFAFLMFFEFVFLIFKKNIYSITHGEPWKDLAFMIGLAALLAPVHHWLEKKVIRYLTSHNRLTAAGKHIRLKLFRRKVEET